MNDYFEQIADIIEEASEELPPSEFELLLEEIKVLCSERGETLIDE